MLQLEVVAYIIDLGKACQIECGRMYTLTEAEREKYKKDHSQIAPDLRDGLTKQSTQSDVYSLGRIIKKLMLKCTARDLHTTTKKCLRPTISQIVETLQALFVGVIIM